MSLFFFSNNFYKKRKSSRFFLQLLEVYRILLVETTLELIIFYYTFSVITTMFVSCTALLHDSTAAPPRLKLTLPWWGGFPPRSFYPSASTRRAQLSIAAKVVRPTDLNNFKYFVNTDSTRLERPSLVKAPFSVLRQSAYMLAVHLVTVHLLAAAGRLPRLVRRKVAIIVGKGGHTPSFLGLPPLPRFLRFPLFRNPRYPHLL